LPNRLADGGGVDFDQLLVVGQLTEWRWDSDFFWHKLNFNFLVQLNLMMNLNQYTFFAANRILIHILSSGPDFAKPFLNMIENRQSW
jgi:hypothetical protein